jgi:hypothetical protein
LAAERDACLRERSQAVGERDAYLRQRDEAIGERNEYLRQRDEALGEREEYLRQGDVTVGPNNQLTEQIARQAHHADMTARRISRAHQLAACRTRQSPICPDSNCVATAGVACNRLEPGG